MSIKTEIDKLESNINAVADNLEARGMIVKERTMQGLIDATEMFDGLKLTANSNNSSIAYTITGSLRDADIEISEDRLIWQDWDGSEIELAQDEARYIRNKSNILSSNSSYLQFVFKGSISASGKIESMINFSDVHSYCFNSLFKGCASLFTTPTLNSTSLAEGCYSSMFQGCTNLTVMPSLPATTLANYCYFNMFRECTGLITVSSLPATTLESNCYKNMFYGCTGIKVAPTIAGTTAAYSCCESMFQGCTGLVIAPELKPTRLEGSCYQNMFKNCTSLKVHEAVTENPIFTCPTTEGISNPVTDMFVGTDGYFKGTPTAGNSYGSTLEQDLKFTSKADNTTISYMILGNISPVDIIASYDGINWFSWDGSTIALTIGKMLWVRNRQRTLSSSPSDYFSFETRGRYDVTGDAMSMINYGNLSNYCFARLFRGALGMNGCPKLPATELTNGCYYYMFAGIATIEKAPELPANQLRDYCYYGMFSSCAGLRVNENGTTGTKIFTCPSLAGLTNPVQNMFNGTVGTFRDNPTEGNTYNWYES